MSGINSTESPFFQRLSSFSDLILLNLLMLVTSIPIVTIGASATALFYAVTKLREGEGKPFKNYFRSFRENFKQATVLWLVMLAAGAAVCYSILLYIELDKSVILACSVLALVIWGIVNSWMFPLLSRFYCTTGAAFKNALLCATNYLPLSLAMALVNLVPLFVFLFVPGIFVALLPLWLCIWFSFAAWCNAGLLKIPMARLEPEEEEKAAGEETEEAPQTPEEAALPEEETGE